MSEEKQIRMKSVVHSTPSQVKVQSVPFFVDFCQ